MITIKKKTATRESTPLPRIWPILRWCQLLCSTVMSHSVSRQIPKVEVFRNKILKPGARAATDKVDIRCSSAPTDRYRRRFPAPRKHAKKPTRGQRRSRTRSGGGCCASTWTRRRKRPRWWRRRSARSTTRSSRKRSKHSECERF